MKTKYKSKLKPRRRKHLEPRWKVIVLWIYLIVTIVSFCWLAYRYQFPFEKTFQHSQNGFINTYTCVSYNKAVYCCEKYPCRISVKDKTSENESDYSYKLSNCYRMEIDRGESYES
jgi:hypothetical protein